jgi:hypothetical protein
MNGATYITHARTPQELKAEVVSDLHRRIAFLEGQASTIARSATEKAKLGTAIAALRDMLVFWDALQIEKTVRKRSFSTAKVQAEEPAP